MQCRASNPLARRIKGWSPKTCLGRPARKTRRTEVMKMKGEGGGNTNKKLERPSVVFYLKPPGALLHQAHNTWLLNNSILNRNLSRYMILRKAFSLYPLIISSLLKSLLLYLKEPRLSTSFVLSFLRIFVLSHLRILSPLSLLHSASSLYLMVVAVLLT